MKSLAILEIADSKFLGFAKQIQSRAEALLFLESLKTAHPDAAHILLCWAILNNSEEYEDEGFDEDGEPPNSVGPVVMKELNDWMKKVSLSSSSSKHEKCNGIVVCVVRYFRHKLLGVTCGRLPQCYQSTCRLSLHRLFNPGNNIPLVQDYLTHEGEKNVYGLCAGDTELILNILPNFSSDHKKKDIVENMITELQYGAFKGSQSENLPRLQNLQADISAGVIPIYRYPGNYNGDEWETFEWSATSLMIKEAVESSLLPLCEQKMNHCVTNYYRNGDDFIAHHSDKDLDLNKNGVIVSVSLGEERIMELRRRANPQEVTRLLLPHGSMLVIGPNTNKTFTHSILIKPDSVAPRISLTFRHVTTFLDQNSGVYFGEGVALKSLEQYRKASLKENCLLFLGFCSLSGLFIKKRNRYTVDIKSSVTLAGLLVVSSYSYRYARKVMRKYHEEKLARAFFSKSSVSGTKY